MTKALRMPLLLLQNTVFWLLFPVVTLGCFVVAALVVLAALALGRGRRTGLRLIRRSISRYGTLVLHCGWPFARVRYRDLAPGDRTPFVAVANHRSAADPFLMACLPVELIQVVNRWPFRLPLLGMVARLGGYIDVRAMSFEQFLETGGALLRQGVAVVAFPEGTRATGPAMGPFHGAAFRLAQQAGVPVVPLAISGSGRILPKGSLLLRPGIIRLDKLPAFSAERCADMTPFALKTAVHRAIEEHLAVREGVA
jgi:1-acyl-sn-glycerol-3-phosphate acyltransferase